MAIRDILNHSGETIGTLELPDETTEGQWTVALALHSFVPPTPTITQIVSTKIQLAIAFGQNMIVSAATDNVLSGITAAGKTKEISDYLKTLGRYLREGSLYAAVQEINNLVSEGIPENVQPFVTEEKLLNAQSKIMTFLGL